MLYVSVCDDNKEALQKYSDLIMQIALDNDLQVRVTCFFSGEQLMFEPLDKLLAMDIIYIDMLMGRLNGIDTAEALRNAGFKGQMIFLTSSKDYLLDAFEVAPLHYILKQETTDEKFEAVFLKAASLAQSRQSESFSFDTHGRITRIPLTEILYFEVQIRQVHLCTMSEKYCFYAKIDDVEKQLCESGFVRCHRAFVVNLQYVRSISNIEIVLTNSCIVPVGSKYVKELKRKFSDFLQSKSVII